MTIPRRNHHPAGTDCLPLLDKIHAINAIHTEHKEVAYLGVVSAPIGSFRNQEKLQVRMPQRHGCFIAVWVTSGKEGNFLLAYLHH